MKRALENYLTFVKCVIPKEELSTAVGLDIGVSSCKLVEIVKKGNSFELVNWVIEPIKENDVVTSVKSILTKVSQPTKSPITAVFGKGTLIRCVTVPRMPLEEVKKSLNIEADKYFPFAKDQIYTDSYILDQESQDKKMSVLIAAAKREIIEGRIKLLNDLGLHADFISLNPIAIGNVFYVFNEPTADKKKNIPKEEGSTAIAVLDIGETVSSLTVILGRLPRFARDIFMGGQDLTKRIMHAFGINPQEAEQIKTHPQEKLNEVINASDASLMNLITEMRLSFDYFTTEYNFHISKLYLSGGTSLLEGVTDYFSKNIDIPVEQWNPLAYVNIPSPLVGHELTKNASRLGVALGLALNHYD